MAISINSLVFSFNSKLPAKYRDASKPKATEFIFSSGSFDSKVYIKERRRRRRSFHLSVAESDRLATDTTNKPPDDSNNKSGIETSEPSNGSVVSSSSKTPKRSPLTARERLKAARVLSRNTEPKTSKSEMGKKVLDASKESDRGNKKKPGLPEAPTDLFDDNKRGLPKEGWTFQFPGGNDLLVVAFSFVFISTVMFATTYIVWKVGAIHFNEY